MKSQKQLSKIVDRPRVPWSNLTRSLRYRAALIVRNVRYRNWDVKDVEFELKLITNMEKMTVPKIQITLPRENGRIK